MIDRSKIIGGSDIAAVMGLNRWVTPLRLWAEKTGKIARCDASEAMEIGAELEEYVAQKFAKKTGLKLRRDSRTFAHTDYPYMIGHIDRWIVGEDAGFEAKTTSAWKAKEWEGEDIPQEYILQCNWYMGIVRKSQWHIACLIGGQKFVYKRLNFDAEIFSQQVDAAKYFMEEFILKDIPPLAQEGDSATLIELFPESKPESVKFNSTDAETIDLLAEERAIAIEHIKIAEGEVERIEAQLKQKLGEAEVGETDKYRLSWKTQHRKEYVVPAKDYRVFKVTKRINNDRHDDANQVSKKVVDNRGTT